MGRHRVDLLSLFSGLPVLAVGLLLLSGGLNGLPMEWAGPAVAIGLGVLIAVAARQAGEAGPARPARPARPAGPARPAREAGEDEPDRVSQA